LILSKQKKWIGKKTAKKDGPNKKKHCADKKKGLFHKKTLSQKKIFKKKMLIERMPHI